MKNNLKCSTLSTLGLGKVNIASFEWSDQKSTNQKIAITPPGSLLPFCKYFFAD
jgi:hypothetical protein